MNTHRLLITIATLGLTLGSVGRAQQTAAIPPIRQLGRRLATTADTVGTISDVRQLSDGRVLVNDPGDRRVLLYDSTLSHAIVIVDSTTKTNKTYGSVAGRLIAARADTTLFVDPLALALLVIDPAGRIVKTEAPPRPKDAPALSLSIGNAAEDGRGRVVYRNVSGGCGAGRGCYYVPGNPDTSTHNSSNLPGYARHDSAAILRGDLATHVIDTVGFVASAFIPTFSFRDNPDGSRTATQTVLNPLPLLDDWAVVSDGSVAFVRGVDYHIDWVNADGSRSSTPKIAHDWHRLSDSDRMAIIDSMKRVQDSITRVQVALSARTDSINKARGLTALTPAQRVYVWPDPSDLPDYRPIVAQGTVRADADDNLWIRPAVPTAFIMGGAPPSDQAPPTPPVFDVVNRQGLLIDRIQLPPSLSLAGFGPGVVYLTSREGWGTVLLKYRIR